MIHLWLDFQLIFVRICTYDTCKCDSKMIAIIMWFATPRSTHDMGFSNVQPQQPYFTTELSANCLTLGRGSCTKKVTKVLVPINNPADLCSTYREPTVVCPSASEPTEALLRNNRPVQNLTGSRCHNPLSTK